MADERYKWLDRRAAERLLRGEPVESADDQVRADAERLSDHLNRAAKVSENGAAGLPGEEAALAAFREASGARTRAPLGDDTPMAVRLTPAPGPGPTARPRRHVRWGRPVNFGLAAALACCALGSVAVAAGTGVLPTPFGDRARPEPAVSVSAVGEPETRMSHAPGTTVPSDPAPATSGPATPDGATQGPGTPATSPDPSDGTGSTTAPEGGTAREDSAERNRKWLIQACRDYRSGRGLAEDRRRRLSEDAGGAHRVERFCKRLLDTGTGDAGDGKSGDQDGGGGDGGSGNGDGDDAGKPNPDPDAGMAPAPPLDFVPAGQGAVTLFEPVTQ
ncbi:hypothetical protein [Streptomyces sp. NPDC051219]|uniref:hypothetical protein n=1 Tax=Streptomyces sp. NPDC051219 TaxID=3155283 RepID=UPI0034141B77